jgi:hypothetical protein
MPINKDQIDKLIAFKNRDKFSTQLWNERGLYPPGDEICQAMTKLFDSCADNLIASINHNASKRQLKSVLKEGLSGFNDPDYNTEEKEFICDIFYELTTITDIDFKDDLSNLLYGPALTTLSKIYKFIRPEREIETLSQPCTNCKADLQTYIMQKEKGLPDLSWFIIKCNKCSNLNLMSLVPGIKEFKYGNYQMVDTLSKEEYTQEQALIRMEQIKLFRK